MSKTINQDMPIGKLTRIKDMLPSPNALAAPEEVVKVTLFLRKSSINFFKHQAELYHTKYQRMIRQLVDKYANAYS